MNAPDLSEIISTAPTTAGVYTWRDSTARPLYIGKAANIKSRLSSYKKATDSRILAMIDEAATLEWTQTSTDIEALIAESQLIKRWRPKYNIVMRDDKQYFLVAITDTEFPQFIITHQAASTKIKHPIKELIGPFTEGLPLKSTLRLLRNLFPYCTCKQKHHLRCLNAHIGKCPGYCCLKAKSSKLQATSYRKNVRAIRDILTGKRDTVITNLEKDMKAAAARHDLEEAMELQTKVERIRRVFENAQVNARRQALSPQHHGALEQLEHTLGLTRVPRRIEGYDIANIQGQHATGSMVVFTDGRADNQEYRKFNIKTVIGSNDTAMLREIISRRLTHPEWQYPDLILIDGGKAQLNAAVSTLNHMGLSIPVVSIKKDDRHQGEYLLSSSNPVAIKLSELPRPLTNLVLHIDSEAHRFAISHYRRRHSRSLVK